MIFLLLAIAGIANAISELSNQGKLNFLHRQWWSQEGWMNKNNWKPQPLWRYFPFIMITDAFHFFKLIWVLSFCISIAIGGATFIIAYLVYSILFEIIYRIFPILISIIKKK